MKNIPYSDYGIAGLETDAFTQIELFAGDTPPVVTDYGKVPAALATAGIPAWTPVFVDPETREVSLAEYSADPEAPGKAPNAITVVSIQAGAPADSNVPVYKAGMFNVRALNWPESFDTDGKKAAAFATSAGNQIYTKEPYGQ